MGFGYKEKEGSLGSRVGNMDNTIFWAEFSLNLNVGAEKGGKFKRQFPHGNLCHLQTSFYSGVSGSKEVSECSASICKPTWNISSRMDPADDRRQPLVACSYEAISIFHVIITFWEWLLCQCMKPPPPPNLLTPRTKQGGNTCALLFPGCLEWLPMFKRHFHVQTEIIETAF